MEGKRVNKVNPAFSIKPHKKIPSQLIIKDAVDKLYKIGNSGTRKKGNHLLEPKWHKCLRYIIGVMHLIQIMRTILFILLYMTLSEDEATNERIFVYLGDCAHHIPQIRIHWNVFLMQPFMLTFYLQLLHIKNDRVNTKWSELLDCLTGYLKPSEIGLKKAKDIETILKR